MPNGQAFFLDVRSRRSERARPEVFRQSFARVLERLETRAGILGERSGHVGPPSLPGLTAGIERNCLELRLDAFDLALEISLAGANLRFASLDKKQHSIRSTLQR